MSSSIVHAAEVRWDDVVDVVVVGAGAAGFPAALNAVRHGSSAVILEKTATAGGTMYKSGGWHWIPGNSQLGPDQVDSREGFLRFAGRLTGPETYDPDHPTLGLDEWTHRMLGTFYDSAAAASDAMEEMGAFRRLHNREFPDYADLPENEMVRGRMFEVRAEPGASVSMTGEGGDGASMTRQYLAACERYDVPVRHEVAVDAVVVDEDGTVVGVRAGTPDGPRFIGAQQGVVWASGGFTQAPELRRQHLAIPVVGGCASAGCTGDFLKVATALGAPLRNMKHAWMSTVLLERALANPVVPESIFFPPGDSMLWVDRTGRRSVNEKAIYNELGSSFRGWDPNAYDNSQRIRVMVWDERTHRRYRSTDPQHVAMFSEQEPTGKFGGAGEQQVFLERFLVRGSTIEELAANVAARVDGLRSHTGGFTLSPDFTTALRSTVERFNEHARAGVDPDFGRGEALISQVFQGPAQDDNVSGNSTMFPLADEGPFYAVLVAPGTLDTKGGPVTDTDARVLDTDGEPIPGLYAAGNCAASPSAGAYFGAGATIGMAMAFAYRASEHAAARPRRPLGAAVLT